MEGKPLVAKLVKDAIWIVKGSLPKNDERGHWVGGVARAEITANNCKIIKIMHGT